MSWREGIRLLETCDWHVDFHDEPQELPQTLVSRYGAGMYGLEELLRQVAVCASPDQTAWLVTADQFTEGAEWPWDFVEQMSLEDADEEESARVKLFWDRFMPIGLSANNDYHFLAMDVSQEGRGRIIAADSLQYDEWEDGDYVADCLDSLFGMLADSDSAPDGIRFFLGT